MWSRIGMAGFVSVATMGGLYALLFGLVRVAAGAPGTTAARIDFQRLSIDSGALRGPDPIYV